MCVCALPHPSMTCHLTINITPVCCHIFVVGGLCTSVTRVAMLARVFILPLGPPKPDRLKNTGQSSSTASICSYLTTFLPLYFPIISPFSMLFSSVYNLFELIGRKAPFTHSLTTINITINSWSLLCDMYSSKNYIDIIHNTLIILSQKVFITKDHTFHFSQYIYSQKELKKRNIYFILTNIGYI